MHQLEYANSPARKQERILQLKARVRELKEEQKQYGKHQLEWHFIDAEIWAAMEELRQLDFWNPEDCLG